MEVYFDNSATTRCYDSVKDIVVKTMTEDFGNPSAMHLKGVEAEKYVKEATKIIAGILKVQEKEILFTSGGTESDNLALIGGALANKRNGNHIIITSVEHAAVSQPALYLQEQGFEITYLPVDVQGRVKMSALEAVLRPDTIMVSTMLVNNEVGAVMPVEEIAKMVHEKSPKALYHVDAIQGFGKYHIYPKRMGIDLLAVSGHKIHGPKGTGFLYIDEKVKIKPIIYGGGQQKGMRSGTENVPGCAGLGLAAKMVYTDHDAKIDKLYAIKDRMVKGLQAMDGVTVHGLTNRDSAPQIVAAGFEGVRAEVLLHALEDKGIYVSSGSACSSNHPGVSGTLKGIGVAQKLLDSTIRISFGIFNTKEEVDYTIDVLKELVPVLRRYQRG